MGGAAWGGVALGWSMVGHTVLHTMIAIVISWKGNLENMQNSSVSFNSSV